MRRRGGFTLIELLVAVGIVAVLAALLMAALGQVRLQNDRTVALSNLRQIGTAISLYTGEHNQVLPGPLFPGQIPLFDSTQSGRLPVMLAGYLGISPAPAPFLVDLFIPPAYQRSLPPGKTLETCRTFVMNMQVAADSGTINPWGSSVVVPPTVPLPANRIANPASVWALSDADQQHPAVIKASWCSFTPLKPIHGNCRLSLFFDGHAARMELTDFSPPQ